MDVIKLKFKLKLHITKTNIFLNLQSKHPNKENLINALLLVHRLGILKLLVLKRNFSQMISGFFLLLYQD